MGTCHAHSPCQLTRIGGRWDNLRGRGIRAHRVETRWLTQIQSADLLANSAPSIAPDGTIYFSCGYSWLCAVEDSGSPLMQSAWPKQFHDLANSSNILHSAN